MALLQVAIIGAFATALADLWQQLLKRLLDMPTANWRLIGRWVAAMRSGRFVHHSIIEVAPVPGEAAIGWIFHYLVGVVYAAIYLALVRVLPGTGPNLTSALIFSLATLVAPWFLMQPALGFGVMARHLPGRLEVSVVTVTTHMMFGLGLFLGMALCVSD